MATTTATMAAAVAASEEATFRDHLARKPGIGISLVLFFGVILGTWFFIYTTPEWGDDAAFFAWTSTIFLACTSLGKSSRKESNVKSRERGTLRNTLPRRPLFLVAFFCAASAVLATALFSYSSHAEVVGLAGLGFSALLGAASTSVGIMFGDSMSHVFAFGLSMLYVGYGDVKSSVVAALIPLFLAALASMRGSRSAMSLLDSSSFLLKPVTLQSCCLVPFLVLVHQSIVNAEHLVISAVPSISVAFLTLLLMHVYSKYRVHPNGNLLTSETKSQVVFAGISMLLSCSIIMESESKTEASKALVFFLLGSLFALLFGLIFAFVGDAWYSIGSGQFQMVSLDTIGIMFYVISPIVVLSYRLFDKYGESIASQSALLKGYVQSTGFLSGDAYGGELISFSLVMTLATITAVGVPLLNTLSPMGGYLFSRAYTHGQPATKKVALCVNYSDLPKGAKQRDDILNCLEKKKTDGQTTAVLNVFVTLEDLKQFSTELKLIADKGHAIALAPSVDDGEKKICGLSLFRGSKASCKLESARSEYSKVFGKKPSWVFANSVDSNGRHPSLLHTASDLGMRVAYWSTLVRLTGGGALTGEQKMAVSKDCSDKDGGSIIYVTLEQGVSSSTTSALICELIDAQDGFILQSLSEVVRDDFNLILK
eukprot:CAMPEP_0172534322 /NCGR_PEP_ID=MMETSP1067-20121228/6724_1 /TAXON_ID=265564 ORGANISM="Thalassiosira punctigera, Strain Tpunct2005C2" /NCGR_SAMPLE_ID=MMETSP1067 /ASSEMBLY_ACC=CAM_ASM_000444 /LENGTH=653 /DNA_ID=CAMNT_0013319099 /DNA_START=94 /DNA_END=2055 /DNA_ORIENTATION=+